MPCSQAAQQAADSTLAGLGSGIAPRSVGRAASWWGGGFACRAGDPAAQALLARGDQACWQGQQALHRQGLAALNGRRLFSTEQPGMADRLKSAQQTASKVLMAPGRAANSIRESAKSTSLVAYNQLPAPAQRWVNAVYKPGSLQKAIGLQIEAFWHRHGNKVFAALGVFGVYLLWKFMFGMTSVFVNLSETMAETGFLALAAAIVAFTFLYFRRQYTISPEAVYRQAMIRLNTSPGVLEVMGAPLAGSPVRATVTGGGGLRLKGLQPVWRSRRLYMLFPLKGTERRGIVSLEAKKRQGRYSFKLLAVDVPSAVGRQQRIFLEGDEKGYSRGGIMGELRDPFIRVQQAEQHFEVEDDLDEAADEAEEALNRRIADAKKALHRPKPLDDGGGMYFYERAWHSLRGLSGKAAAAARKSVQNNEAQQKQPATVLERMSDHTNAEAPPTSR